MTETYSASESHAYYMEETAYGQTPSNPSMVSVPAESLEPALSPSNIKVRGVGSIDLQTIKRGIRDTSLKIGYALPSDAPINFLQYSKAELNKSLSIQLLYYKGVFDSAINIASLLYKGCKFQRVTVECSVEDIVKATAELVGQNLEVGTAKISGATYAEHAGAVPFYESYVKKATATLERVTDWKFIIENNLKQVPVIHATDGYLLKYLPYRHRSLTGELVFEFESKEEFDDVIGDQEFTLEFGLGGANKAVFSGCKWENVTAPTRIEELVSCKASFVAKGPVTIS